MATLRTRGEITAPPMHQNARQRLGTGLAVDSFIALGPLVSVRKLCESFESVKGRGVERLELSVILCAAPLREVPDVDDQEPPPLRPRQVALSK